MSEYEEQLEEACDEFKIYVKTNFDQLNEKIKKLEVKSGDMHEKMPNQRNVS